MPVGFAARGPLALPSEAVAYDPSADTGMVLWLDASDTAEGPRNSGSVPTNGQDVTSWRDSHNLYDLLAAGGNPTFVTNSLNSLPGVTFDASANGVLATTADAVALNSNVLSIFVLMTNLTGGDGAGRIVSIWGAGQASDADNNKSVLIAQQGGTTEGFLTFGNNAHIGAASDSSFAFNTPKVVGMIIDEDDFGHRYLSGIEQGTATAWTTPIGATTATIGIGAQPPANSNASCRIYEAIITTTDLTDQLAGVAAYFTNKWGTY